MNETVTATFILGLFFVPMILLVILLLFWSPINRLTERTTCTQCGKVGHGTLGQLTKHDGWRDVGPIDPFGYAIAICPDHFIQDHSHEKRMGSFSSPYEVE